MVGHRVHLIAVVVAAITLCSSSTALAAGGADPSLTPGATNPAVTQATITTTMFLDWEPANRRRRMGGALALTLVHANGAVLRAAGEIDMATEPDLTRCLDMLTGDVVFDLSAVTSLDSTGINALVRTRNRLTATGGELTRNCS